MEASGIPGDGIFDPQTLAGFDGKEGRKALIAYNAGPDWVRKMDQYKKKLENGINFFAFDGKCLFSKGMERYEKIMENNR